MAKARATDPSLFDLPDLPEPSSRVPPPPGGSSDVVALHDAAQFYWGLPQAWVEGRRIFGPRSLPVLVPRWRVQDIDNEDDWVRAEIVAPLIMNKKQ